MQILATEHQNHKYHMSPNFHYSFKILANHNVSSHQILIRVYNISISLLVVYDRIASGIMRFQAHILLYMHI